MGKVTRRFLLPALAAPLAVSMALLPSPPPGSDLLASAQPAGTGAAAGTDPPAQWPVRAVPPDIPPAPEAVDSDGTDRRGDRERAPVAEVAKVAKVKPTVKIARRLPLGPADLLETRTTRRIAKGVSLTTIIRGPRPGQDSSRRNGPWVIRAITLDPSKAEGNIATTYGPTIAGTLPTTALTRSVGALTGVNASFYSLTADRQYPGIPVGLTAAGGRVLSQPTGRSAEVTLLVDSTSNELHIGRFSWSGRLRNDVTGATRRLDAVNQPPRVPRSCPGATIGPTCRGRGQIVAFTGDFARTTPSGAGLEVVLDHKGCAKQVRQTRGIRLNTRQTSLQATGRSVTALREVLRQGCIQVRDSLVDAKDEPVELHPGISAVTGRYRLLRNGKITVPERSGSFFGRHPRTIAGTTADGKIMFITVDGRQRHSVGATLKEAARIARALGLQDAANLDGGGSTTMAVRGRLVNSPAGPERAVADALVWRTRPES